MYESIDLSQNLKGKDSSNELLNRNRSESNKKKINSRYFNEDTSEGKKIDKSGQSSQKIKSFSLTQMHRNSLRESENKQNFVNEHNYINRIEQNKSFLIKSRF